MTAQGLELGVEAKMPFLSHIKYSLCSDVACSFHFIGKKESKSPGILKAGLG